MKILYTGTTEIDADCFVVDYSRKDKAGWWLLAPIETGNKTDGGKDDTTPRKS